MTDQPAKLSGGSTQLRCEPAIAHANTFNPYWPSDASHFAFDRYHVTPVAMAFLMGRNL